MKSKALGLILFFVALNLQSQEISKSIIIDDFFYQRVNGESSQFIFFQNIIDTVIIVDSFPVSASLKKENGAYFSNPLSWDISDSLLFVVNIFEDNFGMNYTQLRSYNILKLKKLCLINGDSLVNYLLSTKSIKSKPIGPLEKYSSSITYNTDTLVRKVYFDIFCKKRELNLIVYLEPVNKIEIWTFTRFPIFKGTVDTDDKVIVERIYSKKPWELIASISIDHSLAAPFKAVHTKGNDYIVTSKGEIYHIGTTQLELLEKIPIESERMLILDKSRDEVYLIAQDALRSSTTVPLSQSLRKSAIRVLAGN